MEYILQNYRDSQLSSIFYSIQHIKNKELLILNHTKKGAIMYINKEIYDRYNTILSHIKQGSLLCLGLGLGLCYHLLKDNVDIDFVEKDNDLINFLHPITQDWKNVNIYHADAILYQPTKKYDYVFCDIAIKKEKRNKEIALEIKKHYKNSTVIFLNGMYE